MIRFGLRDSTDELADYKIDVGGCHHQIADEFADIGVDCISGHNHRR
jgi:hypothetical protein